MNTAEVKRIVEAALICARSPLSIQALGDLFCNAESVETIQAAVDELVRDWQPRGAELVFKGDGWRLQGRSEIREYLDRLNPEARPQYPRAVLEVLAVVAYRQPVTREEIGDIRGISVNSNTLMQLEERGWIEVIGRRGGGAGPALYGTTLKFLDDLKLTGLDQLLLDHGTKEPPL